MATKRCRECIHWNKDHPAGLLHANEDLFLCEKYDMYTFRETEWCTLDDEVIPDDEEINDPEFLDDVSEIGYDPYLGCYTEDC